MLIHSRIGSRIKIIDSMNDLLESGLPIGSFVVIVDDFDLDIGGFLNFNQIHNVCLIEEGDINTLFSSTARSA